MDLQDESFLSAYLDGELDAPQRLAVEAILRSQPQLAERLRELRAVRDLVARLPRPALDHDLAPAVLERIAHPSITARLLRYRPAWLSEGWIRTGAAAMLLLGATLAVLAPHGRRHAPPAPEQDVVINHPDQGNPAPIEDVTPPSAVSSGAETAPEPEVHPSLASIFENPFGPAAAHAALADSHDVDAQQHERLRQLLDSPRLRRVFLVADKLGAGIGERVQTIVQQTPRDHSPYGRITIAPEIIIDPEHPGAATVYVLVMNDSELSHFQKKLRDACPGAVQEEAPDPAVVTQLADIGDVVVLPGTTPAAVEIPDEGESTRVALRRALPLGEAPAASESPTTPADHRRNGPSRDDLAPLLGSSRPRPFEAPIANPSALAEGRGSTSGDLAVVLVWVERR
jgi:hypothetical protein